MRIGVVGSRSITTYSTVSDAIINCPWFQMPYNPSRWDTEAYTIVSGGADGVDSSAERFAEKHGFEMVVLEPDYDDWSGAHPAKKRNTRIVEESDAIVAVWDGSSEGTRDTIDKALDRAVPLYVETLR